MANSVACMLRSEYICDQQCCKMMSGYIAVTNEALRLRVSEWLATLSDIKGVYCLPNKNKNISNNPLIGMH